jgi:hypothetical protein
LTEQRLLQLARRDQGCGITRRALAAFISFANAVLCAQLLAASSFSVKGRITVQDERIGIHSLAS